MSIIPHKTLNKLNKFFVDNNNSLYRSFFLYPTNPEEILKAIHRVCNKRSYGVDGIPGTLLIEVAEILSYPLSVVINRSFAQGIYPEILKKSRILPIYKGKGDKREKL